MQLGHAAEKFSAVKVIFACQPNVIMQAGELRSN